MVVNERRSNRSPRRRAGGGLERFLWSIPSVIVLLAAAGTAIPLRALFPGSSFPRRVPIKREVIHHPALYIVPPEDAYALRSLDSLRAAVISATPRLVSITYTFREGDTLERLAERFGTDVASIRSSNRIEAAGLMRPGMELVIANKKGVLHRFKRHETLEAVAQRFNKRPDELLVANDKPPMYRFGEGEYLLIPDCYLRFREFMVPLTNTRVTSPFGYRSHPVFYERKFHEGIDLKQRYGAPVRASNDGLVSFAGWREGYGRLVIIKHAQRMSTYYGHLARISVRKGARVNKGQIIGTVGMSGISTGPHLHFEVHKDDVPINPAKVLF